MKYLKYTVVFILIIFNTTIARVEIEFGESLNYGTYPTLSLKFKVLKDGQPISITSTQVIILEGFYPIKPLAVSNPDFSGFQTLNWISSSPNSEIPQIFVTVEDEVGKAIPNNIVPHPLYSSVSTYIKFVDNDRNLIKEVRFPNVPVGEFSNQRINIVSGLEKSQGSARYPTKVDWVGTTSPEFKYLWLGSTINTNSPPVQIISPFPYAIEVLFFPQDTKYKREYLTISYDNGRQNHIALVANTFPIPKRTQLTLIKPEPNEILYPCQNFLIQWKGNKLNYNVLVEYTANKGKTWTKISDAIGSNANWAVPNIDTDSLFIRISQNFAPSSEVPISTKASQPQKIAFSRDGAKILSATKDGKVTEIETKSKTELKTITITNLNIPFEQAKITGLDYFNSDTFAIVSYRWSDFYGYEKNDTLVLINLIKSQIIKILSIPEGNRIKQFVVDEQNKRLLLVRENNNNIEIYSLPELTFQSKLSLSSPIQRVAKRNNLIAIALLSNHIQLFSLDNFVKINDIEIKYQPIITNIAISNDERLIAYTTKKDSIKDILENFSDAFVIDISSKQIVRSLYKNWSDAIGIDFSPTDNYVVIGFENNPVMVLWDLVNDVRSAEIYGTGYNITDFKVSPESFIVATAETERNLVMLREFSYPESVIAGPFKIHKPRIQIKEVVLPPQKIYYSTTNRITDNFCNIGDVPLIVDNAYFVKGKNFSLANNIVGETILTGNCLPLQINYNPKDTGNFVDTLVIVFCGEKYTLPLRGKGINRDFRFLVSAIDFGSVCVNETKEIEIELGFNNDTLDLPVNFVRIFPNGQKYFSVEDGNQYQVLNSNEKLKIKLKFQPKEIGKFSSFVEIYYLGQWDYVFRIPITGEGFGVEISLSTYDIRFIPEIPTRELTMNNLSNIEISVDSLVFDPDGYFVSNVATPFSLQSNSGKIINITMISPPPSDVTMTVYSSPCSSARTLMLGNYTGTSTIILPRIETEPKGIITLPIGFQNTENLPYNERRFFEGEISLNSKMFLPLAIESEIGTATITNNQIDGDKRTISFRVEGNFPTAGTIAKIIGNVALAESDSTNIIWSPASNFWGKNVKVSTNQGVLKLVGLCGNRRIFIENDFIKDIGIAPNPTTDNLELSFSPIADGILKIEIFDVIGNSLFKETLWVTPGFQKKMLSVKNFSPGIYRLVISNEGKPVTIEFIKM
jgi:hypothetical protein